MTSSSSSSSSKLCSANNNKLAWLRNIFNSSNNISNNNNSNSNNSNEDRDEESLKVTCHGLPHHWSKKGTTKRCVFPQSLFQFIPFYFIHTLRAVFIMYLFNVIVFFLLACCLNCEFVCLSVFSGTRPATRSLHYRIYWLILLSFFERSGIVSRLNLNNLIRGHPKMTSAKGLLISDVDVIFGWPLTGYLSGILFFLSYNQILYSKKITQKEKRNREKKKKIRFLVMFIILLEILKFKQSISTQKISIDNKKSNINK